MVFTLGNKGPLEVVGEEWGELVVTSGHKHLLPQLRDQLDDGSEGEVVVELILSVVSDKEARNNRTISSSLVP